MEEFELYAWMGEDELGSGEIGIKQAQVPAGYIPLVAIKPEKIAAEYIKEQLLKQAVTYGKKIYLVRFKFSEIVETLNPTVPKEQE